MQGTARAGLTAETKKEKSGGIAMSKDVESRQYKSFMKGLDEKRRTVVSGKGPH